MEMSGGFLVQSRLTEEEKAPWYVTIIDVFLQYWPNDNVITDENGKVVYNIFDIITPNDLAMFKARPFWNMYFLHVGKKDTVVGISYKDPCYFEHGDYLRYPTIEAQLKLRKKELSRFEPDAKFYVKGILKDLSKTSNKVFRRIVDFEWYTNFYDDGLIGPNVVTEPELLVMTAEINPLTVNSKEDFIQTYILERNDHHDVS